MEQLLLLPSFLPCRQIAEDAFITWPLCGVSKCLIPLDPAERGTAAMTGALWFPVLGDDQHNSRNKVATAKVNNNRREGMQGVKMKEMVAIIPLLGNSFKIRIAVLQLRSVHPFNAFLFKRCTWLVIWGYSSLNGYKMKEICKWSKT